MRLTARVSKEDRRRVDALAAQWGLGNAETVRRLIIFGLGGTEDQAQRLSDEMAGHRARALELHERRSAAAKQPTSQQGRAPLRGTEPLPMLSVRLPASWGRAVRKVPGRLREVVSRGLAVVYGVRL
jgi:hypothetical protein